MALKDSLLPEFDHEMALTRRVLERTPLQDAAWRPHARSMSLGELSTHLANIPSWVPSILRGSGYDMTPENEAPRREVLGTTDALLAELDRNVTAARQLIAETSDAQYMEPWSLKDRGKEVFTMPKVASLRSFLFSHSIHHRGQLSVFLRLRDVPVPAMYGPSGDER
jgi:uncharacterized damage-inducible protein DinB